MKLKDNLSVRKLGNEYIMISENGSTLDYTRVISLNETAAYLIMKVEGSEFTKDELVNNLVEKYNIDIKKAEKDVQKLLDKLKKEGLIDE